MYSFTALSISLFVTPKTPSSTLSKTRLRAIVSDIEGDFTHTLPFIPIAISNGIDAARVCNKGNLGSSSLFVSFAFLYFFDHLEGRRVQVLTVLPIVMIS